MIKNLAYFSLIMIFYHTPVHADVDRVLFYTSTSLILLDWKSTHDLVIDEDHQERNVVLGPNPSNLHVNYYFMSALVANTLCYKFLPENYKKAYLITIIILETLVISSNYSSNHASFKYYF